MNILKIQLRPFWQEIPMDHLRSRRSHRSILRKQLAYLEEIFFTATLTSHLLKITKRQISRSGEVKPMIPISLSQELVPGAGEASAVFQDITLQRQFSLADSLH
jgi:hypothetical protein